MEEKKTRGLIYRIQRFAIHDGPGIRSLVYMKGCPLSCLWCSSPESQRAIPELIHSQVQCQSCGRCAEACPARLIDVTTSGVWQLNRDLCDGCGKCAPVCLNEALELVGRSVTPEELFKEVSKDDTFYRRSGGGVTIGGGEPTYQPDFLVSFLQLCRFNYLNTAIESCGYATPEVFGKVISNVDLVYMDIKHMDSQEHKRITGVENSLILDNALLASRQKSLILRIPLVPGINDTQENVRATAAFAAGLGSGFRRLELLPYHGFGAATYPKLGLKYRLEDLKPPIIDETEKLRQLAESAGIEVRIGG